MNKRNKVGHFILLGTMGVSSIVANTNSTTGSAAAVSPALISLLNTAGTVGKGLLAFSLATVKGVVSTFSVPIFLLLFFRIIYYNYFVLRGGAVQDVASSIFTLPTKGLGFIYRGVASLFGKGSSEHENKDLVLNDKDSPKLISISELKKEVGGLEKDLLSLGNDPSKDINFKNRVAKLKSRICATRGVFSDGNIRSFSSWNNSFWYYLTTSTLFWNTRYEYNELEKKLENYESVYDGFSEVIKLVNDLQNEKNEETSLADLLTDNNRKDSLYGKVKSIFDKTEGFKAKVPKICEDLKKKLTNTYISLINKVIEGQIKKDKSKIGDIAKVLSDNIENFRSLFSEEGIDELKNSAYRLEKLKGIIEVNEQTEKVLGNIRGNFNNAQLKEQLQNILAALKPGFLDKTLNYFKNNTLTDNQENLLINISKNYSNLENCYQSCEREIKEEIKERNIFDFNNSVEQFRINLDILKMIFKNNEQHNVLLNAGAALKSVNSFIAEVYKDVENNINKLPLEDKFSDYCQKIKGCIENAIKFLREDYRVNHEGILNNTVKLKLDLSIDNYTNKIKEVENICKIVLEWPVKIRYMIQEKGEKGFDTENLEKTAENICSNKDLDGLMNKLDPLYKTGMLEEFARLKKNLVRIVKEQLEKEFDTERSSITKLKEDFERNLVETDKLLSNTNIGDYKKELQFKNLLEQWQSLQKFKGNNFFSENFNEEKVKKVINCVKAYKEVKEAEKKLKEGKYQLNDFLETVKKIVGFFKTKQRPEKYKSYLENFYRYIVQKVTDAIKYTIEYESTGFDNTSLEILEEISKDLPENMRAYIC